MATENGKRGNAGCGLRAGALRRACCIALSFLIALPVGAAALSAPQASAEPVAAFELEGAPSASAVVEVESGAEAESSLEAAEAAHMPTLEEFLGGGRSL